MIQSSSIRVVGLSTNHWTIILQLFFEGVQSKVAQGVKESEIGYHMAFSKQELRKVIGIYPGREVKKGIESLYRKVEKHLSDEGNLFQVKQDSELLTEHFF